MFKETQLVKVVNDAVYDGKDENIELIEQKLKDENFLRSLLNRKNYRINKILMIDKNIPIHIKQESFLVLQDNEKSDFLHYLITTDIFPSSFYKLLVREGHYVVVDTLARNLSMDPEILDFIAHEKPSHIKHVISNKNVTEETLNYLLTVNETLSLETILHFASVKYPRVLEKVWEKFCSHKLEAGTTLWVKDIREAFLKNSDAPLHLLKKIAATITTPVEYGHLSSNWCLDSELVMLCVNNMESCKNAMVNESNVHAKEIFNNLLTNPTVSVDVIEKFLLKNDSSYQLIDSVDGVLFFQAHLTEQMLEKIVIMFPSNSGIYTIFGHPNCSPKVLRKILETDNIEVRTKYMAMRNLKLKGADDYRNYPDEWLRELAGMEE